MKTSIVALASIMASVAAAQTFRVSGTVVDSESGAPLSRTRVVFTGGPVREQSVITTANGSFSFDAPEGKYTLLAAHRDYGESYGQTRSGNADSSIITGPDRDTTGILMRWRAPIVIRGKVVDESGEPVWDAKVELFAETVTGGKKRIVSLGRGESDEYGNYSWSSLPAGAYYLAATGAPWYFYDPIANGSLTDAGKPVRPYALTYFPSGNDARAAARLTLRPGAEMRADFTLRPAAGAELRFSCPSSPCLGELTVSAVGVGGVETLLTTISVAETNVISAIPAGRYVVRYSGAGQSMRKEIELAGGDMTVEITPKPHPTLVGSVTFENRQHLPRHPVYVNMLDDDTGRVVTVPLGAGGGFSCPALPISRAGLFLSGADGLFIKRMSVEGAGVKDGVIEIADGATVKVNLTASGETGRLKGFVTKGDKPVPMVMVVLAPTVGSANLNIYYGFQTDSDGSFDLPTVPAGDYVLFAVDDQEFEYANPEKVRPYLATGKTVRIEPHGIKTERIELASVEHN